MSLKRENDDVMENENSNRTMRIICRLTPEEYEEIEKKWKASDCRKLSEYLRQVIFSQPMVLSYRNQSMDELLSGLTLLKRELNAIGNNFNQSVKRLHTLSSIPEFKRWQVVYEIEKKTFFNKVDEVKTYIKKISESWLR